MPPTAAAPLSAALVTLGCARNEVDSEELAGQLRADGWRIADDHADADVVVVNTCGFVASAKKDSIDALLAATEAGPSAGPTSAPTGSLTAAALSAAAGSVIAVPADTGMIGLGTAALAGTCPNGSAAPSRMNGRIGAAAPLEVPGRSAATTGATVVRVTATAGTAAGTWLRVTATGPRIVRGVRVAQGRARRSRGRQAGPAGRGTRDVPDARAGRLGSVPVRARAAAATVRTTAGATVAGVTVTGPRRPRRASRIA